MAPGRVRAKRRAHRRRRPARRRRECGEVRSAAPRPGGPWSARGVCFGRGDRHGRGPDGVRPTQRGRGDEALVFHVVERRADDDGEEQARGGDGQRIGQRPPPRRQAGGDGGQPHVLAIEQRQHGAEHGEPEEHDAREFVAPDEGAVEPEPHHHAVQQHADLEQHRRRRGNRDHHPQPALEPAQRRALDGELEARGRGRVQAHVSEPEAASSSCQPSSPNLPRQSL